MLIKGIYLDKYVVLKKTKDFFEISNSSDGDIVVNVLPVKDILINPVKDIFKSFYTYEVCGYKITSKKPIDFEKEDIWVFALLRALEIMNYDDIYVVFKEDKNYILSYVKDKNLVYYEVFFDKEELIEKVKTLDRPILADADINVSNPLPILYVKKGELLAFGGALKHIKDRFSQKNVLSFKKLKTELINVGVLIAGILISYTLINFSINYELNLVKQKEKQVFKKAFPNTPAVDVKEQLQAMISSPSNSYRLSSVFLKAFENIPPDAKVYEIYFQNNILSVKSQVSPSEITGLKNVYFSNQNQVIQRWITKR